MNRTLYFNGGTATATLRQIIEGNTRDKRMKTAAGIVLKEDFLKAFEPQLEKTMLVDKVFLNPRMSVALLALWTFTNRTYVTVSVHVLYGVTFRDFISILRVEYAKSLMVECPKLHEDVIAVRCGFLYASQFIRKFREVTDATPAEWRRAFFNK